MKIGFVYLIALLGATSQSCSSDNIDLLDREIDPVEEEKEDDGSNGDSTQNPIVKAPNVILFFADDLGWTDLGVQGSDFYESPNIDQLAEDGMTFTNAYANASNCAPTRASLISGLYSPRTGVYTVGSPARGNTKNRKLIPIPNKRVLDRSILTLPQAMKNAGYKTCIAGKWHLSDDPVPYGFAKNFGGYDRGSPVSYFSPYNNPALSDGPDGEHLPARLAKEVSNWIDQNKEDPFFVYMPFYSVHTPIQARNDLTNKYASKPDGTYHDNDKYAAMIESMDEAIADVLAKVEELSLTENTIVIFTSDNGQHGPTSFSRPLRGAKGMYYEGGIRVPMFVKWPGEIQAGSETDSPVISLDLFPTIMEMTGNAIPSDLDGKSLMSVLKGGSLDERALHWHFPAYLQMYSNDRAFEDSHDKPHWRAAPCSAIREGDWKLIEYFETGELELFNLANDIGERNNLSEVNTSKRDELYDKMIQWRSETNAPVPTELNPNYEE